MLWVAGMISWEAWSIGLCFQILIPWLPESYAYGDGWVELHFDLLWDLSKILESELSWAILYRWADHHQISFWRPSSYAWLGIYHLWSLDDLLAGHYNPWFEVLGFFLPLDAFLKWMESTILDLCLGSSFYILSECSKPAYIVFYPWSSSSSNFAPLGIMNMATIQYYWWPKLPAKNSLFVVSS